jgi:predicted ABC-type transport system involved in lysophospholipase L1 biosynthesis ATPase subunit
MTETLASMSRVLTPTFRCGELSLEAGSLGVVTVSSIEQGRALVDTLMGLAVPEEGEVRLLGQSLYDWPEGVGKPLPARSVSPECHAR